jgi:hypothetical protein
MPNAPKSPTVIDALVLKMEDLKTVANAQLELLDRISKQLATMMPATAPKKGAWHGAVLGYQPGGIFPGDYADGDQHVIKVAGGEMILTPNQYGKIAESMGVDSNTFRDAVADKDFARMDRFKDGGVVKPQLTERMEKTRAAAAQKRADIIARGAEYRRKQKELSIEITANSKRNANKIDASPDRGFGNSSIFEEWRKKRDSSSPMPTAFDKWKEQKEKETVPLDAFAIWQEKRRQKNATSIGYTDGMPSYARFGAVIPRFAMGGVVPDVKNSQDALKRLAGIDTDVGDTVLAAVRPGERVLPKGSKSEDSDEETRTAKNRIVVVNNTFNVTGMDEVKQIPGMIQDAVDKARQEALGDGLNTSHQSSRDYL